MLRLRAILPGVSQNDLKVSVRNNQLILEGEGFDKNMFPPLSYGKFYTSVSLPAGLDLDKLNCRLHDGVLDIHWRGTTTTAQGHFSVVPSAPKGTGERMELSPLYRYAVAANKSGILRTIAAVEK